jgi:hypothetical protein
MIIALFGWWFIWFGCTGGFLFLFVIKGLCLPGKSDRKDFANSGNRGLLLVRIWHSDFGWCAYWLLVRFFIVGYELNGFVLF